AGRPRPSVDHRAGVVERAQEPTPRVALELRVLAHAGADGRVRDLQQQGIAGGDEHAHIACAPVGDRLWARSEELPGLAGREDRSTHPGADATRLRCARAALVEPTPTMASLPRRVSY